MATFKEKLTKAFLENKENGIKATEVEVQNVIMEEYPDIPWWEICDVQIYWELVKGTTDFDLVNKIVESCCNNSNQPLLRKCANCSKEGQLMNQRTVWVANGTEFCMTCQACKINTKPEELERKLAYCIENTEFTHFLGLFDQDVEDATKDEECCICKNIASVRSCLDADKYICEVCAVRAIEQYIKKETIFNDIASYIIETVQENSITTGFQYVVDGADLEYTFSVKLKEYIEGQIIKALYSREEVAEAFWDTDGCDVTLYTDYAPTYNIMEHNIEFITKEEAVKIIKNQKPEGLFYLQEGEKYIGIDNSTCDAWTKDFNDLVSCIRWLIRETEIED